MPTITRKLVNGPSREELFDALRLQAEGRVVNFDVAMPDRQTTSGMVALKERTEEGIFELILSAMAYYPARISGVTAADSKGELWVVTGVLDDGRGTAGRNVALKATYNTRDRRASGDLEASWEPLLARAA